MLTIPVHPHPHRRNIHSRTPERTLAILVYRLSTDQTRSLNPPFHNRYRINLAMCIQSLGCTLRPRIPFSSLLCT